jgi:predicted AAA+ superfamily ATPase
MVPRIIAKTLRALFRQYPVVTVTGPRQAGKTTLCRATFPKLPYVNLEAPDRREHAVSDPRDFLRRYGRGAILDEIQRAPALLSYIQDHVDELDKPGIFVLTGSQQLDVSQAVTQSLAGRTALLRLLPLSIAELSRLRPQLDAETMIYTGFYPRIHADKLDPTQALASYFETYVERDLRQLSAIRNLTSFERFLRLCAGRVGQLLNLQALGAEAGVSHTTAREWLSLLEASYVVFQLQPYHANISKRLIKSPKLYFYDVGLASYLMGIEDSRQVVTHPLRGALFENLVVGEALKHRYNRGLRGNLFFYRESTGHEVDLLCQLADQFLAVEIKAGATVASDWFANLARIRATLRGQIRDAILVHAGTAAGERQGVRVTNHRGVASLLAEYDVPAKSRGAARRTPAPPG